MSSGVTPAWANASAPLATAADDVKSGHWLMFQCVCAPAAPSTYTGGWRRSRARSAVVRTTAPPPSEITQQSSLCSGSAIMRELTTSSTLRGSRYIALGFSRAYSRTPTAISASCSDVVPNSCM